jgi:predicted nuclease of restriction endonuclease-like (RecB) superfamily
MLINNAILSKIFDTKARNWYEQEAVRESWSVRTLQRNADSQYYYRVLKPYDDKPVRAEMKEIT